MAEGPSEGEYVRIGVRNLSGKLDLTPAGPFSKGDSSYLKIKCPENIELKPKSQRGLALLFKLVLPPGVSVFLDTLPYKKAKGLRVISGVFDIDWEHDIHVKLHNVGKKTIKIKRGEFIAELRVRKGNADKHVEDIVNEASTHLSQDEMDDFVEEFKQLYTPLGMSNE